MIHAFLTSDLPTIAVIMIQRYMIHECAHDYVCVLAVLNFMYTCVHAFYPVQPQTSLHLAKL